MKKWNNISDHMKLTFSFFLSLLLFGLTQAQTFKRFEGQSKDSLVKNTLDKHSTTCGIYEFTNDSASVIPYFQIRSSREMINGEPMYDDTRTIFNLLYSNDKKLYKKFTVDIIGQSNSCWAPVTVDSIFFCNIDQDIQKEMCLILYHYPYCDAYFSFISVIFYDDLQSFCAAKRVKTFPELSFNMYDLPLPDKKGVKLKIVAHLKEKGIVIK
ncbi:MAG: hypothetical protein V2A54_10635 [Bacteroidota bacterium]